MIEFYTSGSIFDCGADAVVIPVNCVGVAGKGVALQARRKWPWWFKHYSDTVCRTCFQPGDVDVLARAGTRECILSAATKGHWRNRSRLIDIERCLVNIRTWALSAKPDVIAIPALGCGCGELAWVAVKQIAEEVFNTPECGRIRTTFRMFHPQ